MQAAANALQRLFLSGFELFRIQTASHPVGYFYEGKWSRFGILQPKTAARQPSIPINRRLVNPAAIPTYRQKRRRSSQTSIRQRTLRFH